MEIYLIIIKKDCKALVTKNHPIRLINTKLERKKTQNMRKKVPTDLSVQVVGRFMPVKAGYADQKS
jgi:hypothetical protein